MDGSLVAKGVVDNSLQTGNPVSILNTSELTIGSRQGGAVATTNAELDDAAIWDRALSASEVSTLWNAAVPEPSSLILILVGCSVLLRRRRSR